MCLAVPGKIIAIEGRSAKVDFGGAVRDVALDLVPEAVIGDYVLAHAGFAIQRLDAQEAHEVLELFEEAFGLSEEQAAE